MTYSRSPSKLVGELGQSPLEHSSSSPNGETSFPTSSLQIPQVSPWPCLLVLWELPNTSFLAQGHSSLGSLSVLVSQLNSRLAWQDECTGSG